MSKSEPDAHTERRLKVLEMNQGITDGSQAPPLQIGESFVVLQSDDEATQLTPGTPYDVLAYTLPPGDWDVTGSVRTLGTSTNIIDIQAWVSPVSETVPPPQTFAFTRLNVGAQGQAGADTALQLTTGPATVNVAQPTLVYVGCMVDWGSGTVLAAGAIRGRRMR